MSVESRLYVGFTVELAKNLSSADFKKAEAFVDKFPELDEYKYWKEEKEGNLILVTDGMNGDFARLILVDKFKDDATLGDGNEFIELTPRALSPEEQKMFEIVYSAYTGKPLDPKDLKYAMWNQWY